MKSKIVLLLVVISFSTLSFAQTNKGNWIVSGNSSLQVSSSKLEGAGSSTTTVVFNPSLGYFVTDGLAVGASVNLLSSDGTTVYAILPAVSYYFQTQSQVKPFVEVGIGYGGISADSDSSGGLVLGADAGIVYLINQNIGINLGMQYLRGDYDGFVNNTFGGVLGFSIFI
ncbi:MAG: outer membrane beta-barrel protein [Proteiniphilum sp.]|nr:outer membrane beta-barrel protein [Proteiniphilum sp.]MDD4158742.1 outer membrane beta-barrel protein [Proteiniphilum sp.]MDD4800620.1 outer membrane beta-barrel protein [Proteiniphilum sp.]